LRTFSNNKGKQIIKIIEEYEPIGIGFRELQRKTGFASNTINRWLKRFQSLKLVEFSSKGKNHLSEYARQKYVDASIEIPLDWESKKYRRSIPIATKKKNGGISKRRESQERRRNDAYGIIISIAMDGDYRYRPTTEAKVGYPCMTDTDTCEEMIFAPYHLPGVGLSDFKKSKGPARLDRRIHVGYSELFADDVDNPFTEAEIQQYIDELKNMQHPVLKQLDIFDMFNLLQFDNLNNNFAKINFLRLYNTNENYNRNSLQLIVNDREHHDNNNYNLRLIYDFNCDNKDSLCIIKLIFDINDLHTIKFLELDTYYKNNNFSVSNWGEPRYIIANPLLREFIGLCWQILGMVLFRMEAAFVYKQWLTGKSLSNTNNLTARYVYGSYIKWYKHLFGCHRFTQQSFSSTEKSRKSVDGLCEFEKYLRKLKYKGKRQGLQYCSIQEVEDSLSNIIKKKNKLHDDAKVEIRQYDKGIKEKYEILMSERYNEVWKRYDHVVKLLLYRFYPDFLRKLHGIH
jgi:hypothetical protein